MDIGGQQRNPGINGQPAALLRILPHPDQRLFDTGVAAEQAQSARISRRPRRPGSIVPVAPAKMLAVIVWAIGRNLPVAGQSGLEGAGQLCPLTTRPVIRDRTHT